MGLFDTPINSTPPFVAPSQNPGPFPSDDNQASPDAAQAANPANPANPARSNPLGAVDHAVGHALGKAISGLSGSHAEYTIDPSTGNTITTSVKNAPGETFRSILALGLMGSQGIGPKNGQVTFAQGLMAGLGSGAATSEARKEQLDDKRRQQAQLDYANKLKAAENTRQEKELTLHDQLQKVQIADYNQQKTLRQMQFDQAAYAFGKLKATDAAQYKIDHDNMIVSADAPMVQGYKDLGIEPIRGEVGVTEDQLGGMPGMTPDMLHKILSHDPSVATKYLALATGVKQVYNPDTKTMDVQPLYSLYEPMTKVPPSLLEGMRSVGAADPHSSLNGLYSSLNAASKGPDGKASATMIMDAYKQFTDWNKIQQDALKTKEELAKIRESDAAAWAADVRANKEQYEFKNERDLDEAEKMFNRYYSAKDNKPIIDPKTNQPLITEELNPDGVDPTTHKAYTRAQKAALMHKQEILLRFTNAMHEKGIQDSKVQKITDAQGNQTLVSSDPDYLTQVRGIGTFMDGIQNGFNFNATTPAASGNNPPATPKVSMITGNITSQNMTPQRAQEILAMTPSVKDDPTNGITDEERQQVVDFIIKRQHDLESQKNQVQQRNDQLDEQLRSVTHPVSSNMSVPPGGSSIGAPGVIHF